jgi:hypothetical protein
MRAFDQRNSYLDDEGKPLIGRVSFYKKGTNVLETITDVAGASLANPVYTNTLGQLVYQVYLQDYTDYTVKFEKYIGNGDFTDDPDIDNWLFLYSCDNLFDVYGISVDCDGVQAVNTINDLIAFDPQILTNDRNFIQVLGYNELGDCEPVYYQWDANSTENTNGGSVIQSSVLNYGRWKLVNTFLEYIDVRHFGVFGTPTRQTASSTMGTQILAVQNYAISIGKKLYFPSFDNDITWYNMRSVGSLIPSLFDTNVWIFDDTTASHRIYVEDNSGLNVYGNGNFTLTGNKVKTSWGKEATHVIYDPDSTLYFDSLCATDQRSSTDIIIEADTNIVIENWSFDGCKLNLVKNIGDGCYFQNCRLEENMFTTTCDYDTITVYDNDIIDIDDWPTTSKWLKLVTQNTSKPLDFKGRTVDNTCYVGWSICQYRNAVFDNYNVIQNQVAFIGCNGTVNITRAAVSFIQLDNSNITFNVQSSTLYISDYLNSVNSSFTFGKNITIKTLTVGKSTIVDAGHIYTVTDTANLDSSTIQVQINAPSIGASKCDLSNVSATYPVIIDCIIRGTIYQYSQFGANIDFILQGNTFYEGSKHSIGAGTAGTKVVGTWIDNTSLCSYHFIELDRSFLDSDEQAHTYTYEGNKGPHVLQKLEANWSDIQIIAGTAGSPKVVTFHQIAGETNFPIRADFNGQQFHVYGGTTNPDVYLTQFSMFSIGTRNIGQLGLKAIIPQHLEGNFYNSPSLIAVCAFTSSVDEKERLWYSDNVGVPAGIVFVNGYTWRITNVSNMYEIQNALGLPQSYFEIPVNYHISKY